MRSLLQKLLALALAALMLFPLAACGTGEQTPDETEGATTDAQTEVETVDPNYALDLPETLQYDTEVNILYVNSDGRSDELENAGLEGGVISDAVYERNLAVEERLGIQFGYSHEDEDTDLFPVIAKLVKSGDTSIDIFSIGTYCCMTPMLAGHYLNLNRIENIDLTKHYWSQGFNEMMTFTSDDLQFVASSPIAISIFRRGYLTIFNRDLFTDHQIPDLYEAVDNGEWTLEYQYNLIKDVYVNTDGDSAESADDFYGFVVGNVGDTDVYAVASDIHIVVRDENGELFFDAGTTDRLVDMCEKVSALCNAQGTYLADSFSEGFQYPVEKFAEKGTLMATTMFGDIETHFESLADMNYGIAPMPKLTREQEDYGTYIQDQVSCFGISASIGDESRQAVLGAVLEAMSYYSYIIVRPAYYDSVLSLRFMQDPQSRAILDTMFESISFDFVYATGFAGFRDNMRPVISSTNPAVASKLKQWEKQIISALRTQQKALERIASKQ